MLRPPEFVAMLDDRRKRSKEMAAENEDTFCPAVTNTADVADMPTVVLLARTMVSEVHIVSSLEECKSRSDELRSKLPIFLKENTTTEV